MSLNSPKLWVVATPLGNLGDLSKRARDVLASVEVVLAEDTRKAGIFLQRLDLPRKRLLSLFEHNEEKRIGTVLELLESKGDVALISSAGTPLIADPGYRLVRACREAGFQVVPVPGPSAPIAALMASGLPPYPFTFLGFLPRKEGEKERLFSAFAALKTTLIFFERSSRIIQTLQTARESLGAREVCIAREISKQYEEFIYLRLEKELKRAEDLRGEITIIIGPAEAEKQTPLEEVLQIMEQESLEGGAAKQIVGRVQEQVKGWKAKELYQLYTQKKSIQD